MNLKITISIDDCHPQKGWRILGDPTENWLRSLSEEFDAKFTLFCPSNYHGQYPISEHKEWVSELANIDWIELAAHGHFHQTSDPKRFGECEFAELVDPEQIMSRLTDMWNEWIVVDYKPIGWRNPGWLCSDESQRRLNMDTFITKSNIGTWGPLHFDYVALHYDHNRKMKWNCKEFFGHDGIQQENISIHNGDMIMFQSHIAGNWNLNVWNEQNYERLRLSLSHLVENYSCEFKTLKECL